MKNIKDWFGATAVAVGKDQKNPRQTILKAAASLSVAAILLSQSNLFSAYVNDGKPDEQKLSFNQIKERISEDSQRLNSIYGSDTKIFVFNDDKNIRDIVENFESGHFADYESDSIITNFSSNIYRVINDVTGLNISNDELGKQAFVSDLNSSLLGPFAGNLKLGEKGENGEDLSVVFVKKDFGGLTEGLDSGYEARYPYSMDRSLQNAYAFFHEMAHGLDDGVGRENTKFLTVQKESVADVAFALIAMRETGTSDIYENMVKPFRLANPKDIGHMTTEIADEALAGVDESKVAGKSDVELMKYAQTLVNNTVAVMFDNVHETSEGKKFDDMTFMMNKFTAFAIKNKKEYNVSFHNLDRMTEGGARETLMDFSRSAMESSLRNLVFTDTLNAKEGDFTKAVERHIKYWHDDMAKESLAEATKSGDFDYTVFAEGMGFRIDDVQLTSQPQVSTVHAYFDAVANNNKDELTMTSISAQPRSGYGMEKSIPEMHR